MRLAKARSVPREVHVPLLTISFEPSHQPSPSVTVRQNCASMSVAGRYMLLAVTFPMVAQACRITEHPHRRADGRV
jgi:hypothetical protein